MNVLSLLDLNNVYTRLSAYALSFIAGMIPAWALGMIIVTPAWMLRIDLEGAAIALSVGILGSLAVFAKWGIRPDYLATDKSLLGSYMRVVMYSVTFVVGLLPANIAATVYIDAVAHILTVDLPALAYALAISLGVNVSVFKMWGMKAPAPKN